MRDGFEIETGIERQYTEAETRAPSPNYGPAGKPSMGRTVRLHMSSHQMAMVVPAVIHEADAETGFCTLVYDLIFYPEPVRREYTTSVPFGPQEDPDLFWWDWIPVVR